MSASESRVAVAPRRVRRKLPSPPPRLDVAARGALQCHLLAFEGPDAYARAGGIATRVTGLAKALAEAGLETHLWFVGDPDLPGHETRDGLHLHRWCQWISRHHPHGVYDGEELKSADLTASLPEFVLREHLGPVLARGGRAVILAEEWHTAEAVVRIDNLACSTVRPPPSWRTAAGSPSGSWVSRRWPPAA